jgi:hypothetical protein
MEKEEGSHAVGKEEQEQWREKGRIKIGGGL